VYLSAVVGSIFKLQTRRLKNTMNNNQEPKQDKPAMWAERLKQAREFPGTIKQYCATSGVTYATLKYWREKLEDSGADKKKKSIKLSSPFVRIEQSAASVTAKVVPELSRSVEASSGARFVAEVLCHMIVMGRESR
jgi:hypothetical protein